MIPEAAVEAAAKALEDVPSYCHDDPAEIRKILEAAAPHMLADAKAAAWDEGANEAWSVSSESFNGEYPDAGEPFAAVANPYRPARG